MIATLDGDLHYRWSYQQNDPLGLDEAKLFLLRWEEQEGENPIMPGAADTFQPPRQWIDGNTEIEGENIVLWYVPLLKTKKGGPWWCMPDPSPDFTPCEAVLRAEPAGPLPTAEEIAQTLAQISPTPEPSPTAENEIQAATPAPTAVASISNIEADTVPELFLNAGCTVCHVIGELGEQNKVGPDLTHISQVAAERVADQSAAEYVRRSILFPNEFITADCPNGPCLGNIMPVNYGERLTALQLEQMVDYLLNQPSVPLTPTAAPIAQSATLSPQPTADPANPINRPAPAAQTNAFSLVIWLLFGISAVFLIFLSRRR